MPDSSSDAPPHDGKLPTTQWTLIARLHSGDPQKVRKALDELCSQYHYPLYCFIRRKGLDHHDAQDALHDFLAKFLRNDSFGAADSDKGRLRTFLLTALQRFIINWHEGQRHREHEFNIDAEAALAGSEQRYQQEHFTDDDAPDRIFERKWAQELMTAVMRRVGARYAADGKRALFEALRPVLLAGGSLRDSDSTALAASLDMTSGALRTALRRLLDDYREELKAEIAQTIDDPAEVNEEFKRLALAFSRN